MVLVSPETPTTATKDAMTKTATPVDLLALFAEVEAAETPLTRALGAASLAAREAESLAWDTLQRAAGNRCDPTTGCNIPASPIPAQRAADVVWRQAKASADAADRALAQAYGCREVYPALKF